MLSETYNENMTGSGFASRFKRKNTSLNKGKISKFKEKAKNKLMNLGSSIKLVIANFVLALVWTVVYFSFNQSWQTGGYFLLNSEGKPPGFIDTFYFAATTTSTVGYGDMSPITTTGKILVMLHQLSIVFVNGAPLF